MNEINFSILIPTMLRKLWIIILTAVVFAGTAFAYCKFVAVPVYEAKSSLIITSGDVVINTYASDYLENGNTSISTSDISNSVSLSKNSVDILSSSEIYKDLAASLGGRYSYRKLRKDFTVEHRDDGKFFLDVSYRNTSKREAVQIVNAFSELSIETIKEIFPSATVMVMDYADSVSQVAPRAFFTTLVAGAIGVVLSAGIIFLIVYLDRTVKGEEDFKAYFDIPLLGSVPNFDDVSTRRYKRYHYYHYRYHYKSYGGYGNSYGNNYGNNYNGDKKTQDTKQKGAK